MHRVVIVGGGFGGLQAALHLKNADVEVTLVDRRNFHLFQPLAYQVATGALAAGEVCYPLRAIFRGDEHVRVDARRGDRRSILARATVALRTAAGEESLGYDTLIVAGGSEYNYFGHAEWQPARGGAQDARGRAAHPRADPARVRGRRGGAGRGGAPSGS